MNEQTLRFSQISILTGLKRHTINARANVAFKPKELQRSTGNQVVLSPLQVKELIKDRLEPIQGKIIYIGNLKGGVGKTTMAYLLTTAISSLGLKVCAIDLDVQANFTSQFMTINSEQPVFFDVIEEKKSIQDVIVNLSPTLDFIPSSLRNSLIKKALAIQQPKHYSSWLNNLCLNYLRSHYDVIIIDTPPSLETLNSVFCLCLDERDQITIPACAEDFSVMGVQMFLDDVISIRNSFQATSNPKVSIVMNRFFQNQKTNLEMLVKMGQEHEGMLSEVIIRDSAKLREMMNKKTPLGQLKHGKEIYEIISNLLQEFNILKKVEA